MVDTRCANPEYQLEVDVMTLEYLLYHAVRAQLAALKAERNDEMDDDDDYTADLEKKVTADRLLAMFDCECITFGGKRFSATILITLTHPPIMRRRIAAY